MESKWLEDFIALSESGSFSKAAKTRNVTQPAYSRRIRALENWLGVSLIDRGFYPTKFTSAGDKFLIFAHQSLAEMYSLREVLRDDLGAVNSITVRTQHSLTVSFLPVWLQTLGPLVGEKLLKVHADDLHDAVDSFLAGSGDFLLCYSSDDITDGLMRDDIESIQVGTDLLVPVTGVNNRGEPLHKINLDTPIKVLNYPQESFFGRLVQRESIKKCRTEISFQPVYESALSEALKAHVLKGYGVTWLPKTLINDELVAKQLHILGEPLLPVKMSIQLYRFRQYQSDPANVFWAYLKELYT